MLEDVVAKAVSQTQVDGHVESSTTPREILVQLRCDGVEPAAILQNALG